MWTSIMSALLGKVAPLAAEFYIKKIELKQAVKLEKLRGKAAYEAAKTMRASESEGRDHEWEIESIRNSGWKDEWVLLLMSIPMIMSFIPSLTPYVVAGFEALDGTPQWYRFLVMSIFAATYGIRLWRRQLSG